ncbi:4-hydroxythreonine-4-phosphate dehydrogenase PdxA, partial [Streptomyces europaeiscabiei]|uniref:4-hydroxythreonine-4-phosphate dehydrogenase PdxA n=1 Tax=Streptomyces europaeiscabiei TaxID=146819 RepID=UPI0038F7ED1C
LGALSRRLNLNVPLREVSDAAQAQAHFSEYLPVLPVKLTAPVALGRPTPDNARATIEAIERAAHLAQSGKIAGMVTNPIQKKTLQDAGFRH